MNTLDTLILIAHVLIATAIIGLVMLQKGKGADAGAGFGAGASGTVFGARGSANFLSRSTAVLAVLFFATSMGLAYLNQSVDVAPSLLEKGIIQELPAGEIMSLPPVDSDELPEPLPLPAEEPDLDAAQTLPVDAGTVPDAAN